MVGFRKGETRPIPGSYCTLRSCLLTGILNLFNSKSLLINRGVGGRLAGTGVPWSCARKTPSTVGGGHPHLTTTHLAFLLDSPRTLRASGKGETTGMTGPVSQPNRTPQSSRLSLSCHHPSTNRPPPLLRQTLPIRTPSVRKPLRLLDIPPTSAPHPDLHTPICFS